MTAVLPKTKTLAALPVLWPEDLRSQIRAMVASQTDHKLVVLDDDPTGTQTVHDVPVLTTWDVATLRAEFAQPGPGFYILTNSRAYPTREACRINGEIGQHLAAAAAESGVNLIVISRSDSTLRGHFPDEVEALGTALGTAAFPPPGGPSFVCDGPVERRPPILLCPYFEAGGRFTIGDVHYVVDRDRLVPAAQTPFARDASFGFDSSNLRDWVVEKSRGRIPAEQITSLSLDDIRRRGPHFLAEQLILRPGQVCIANAASPRDLEVVVLATLMAEARGARMIYRTAASFVAARMGMEPRVLEASAFLPPRQNPATAAGDATTYSLERRANSASGGLIVVGSYVPKTTEQLAHLLERTGMARVELAVDAVLDETSARTAIDEAAQQVGQRLRLGQDVVLCTSRRLVTGANATESLRIGHRVSAALVEVVSRLAAAPRFFVAKGGVTSSDLATKALGVRRAIVRGQILPGIPVWQLGPESRFPGLELHRLPRQRGRTRGAGASRANSNSTPMKTSLWFLTVVVVIGAARALRAAPDMIFPGTNWSVATPESQGLDSAKLKQAVTSLEAHTGRDGARELVIICHGRMVWQGDNIDHVHGIWSCTKSFTSTSS